MRAEYQILRGACEGRDLIEGTRKESVEDPVTRRCSDYIAEVSFVKGTGNESRYELNSPLTSNVG